MNRKITLALLIALALIGLVVFTVRGRHNTSVVTPMATSTATSTVPVVNASSTIIVATGTTVSTGTVDVLELGKDKFGTTTEDKVAKTKTYKNTEYGFEITFPSLYSIDSNNTYDQKWVQRDFFTIYDPRDTSTYEFHIIPVHAILIKQPVVSGGAIYHSIDEYIKNKTHEFFQINGIRVVYYPPPVNGDTGAGDAPTGEYMLIKKDIIFDFFVNSSNPDVQKIIETIVFK